MLLPARGGLFECQPDAAPGLEVTGLVDALAPGGGDNHLLDPAGIHDIDEVAFRIEIDVGALYHHEALGAPVFFRGVKGVNGAARLVKVATGGLLLVRVLEIVPAARQRVEVHGTRVEMLRQRDARREQRAQHPDAVLGVEEERIIEDYLLTNRYLPIDEEVERLSRTLRDQSGLPVSDKVLRPLLEVRPEYLAACFEEIRARYASREHFFEAALNLDPEKLERLRARYLH